MPRHRAQTGTPQHYKLRVMRPSKSSRVTSPLFMRRVMRMTPSSSTSLLSDSMFPTLAFS